MVVVIYVCPVLPEIKTVFSEPDPITGRRSVLVEGKPQRPKIAEIKSVGRFSYIPKIPTDPGNNGLARRLWCRVRVDAEPSGHTILSADAEVWPVPPKEQPDKLDTTKITTERDQAETFLSAKGEATVIRDAETAFDILDVLEDHGGILRTDKERRS